MIPSEGRDLQFYEELLEGAPEAICAAAADGQVTFANRRAEELLGSEIRGRNFLDLVAAEDRPIAGARLADGSGRERLRVRGLETDLELQCAFGRLSGGSVAIVLTDLTAQIRQRDLLAVQVRSFEALASILPVGIGIATDRECRRVRVNPAFAKMLAVSPSVNASKTGEAAGLLPFRVFEAGREVAGSDLPMQVAARENRFVCGQELTLVQTDGRVIEELAFACPLRDARGESQGSIGLFIDITERKTTERRLREAERRFRRLYESDIIGIFSSDSDSILEANDIFLEMVGYSREDLEAGRLVWREMTPPEHLKSSLRAANELLASGSFGPFEKEYIRKDGERVPVLLGAIRVEGEPPLNLCFAIDLTERRKLERRVLEAQKLESVGLLAAGIAHDFNNLLVGVIGNASLAQDLLPPDHEVQPLLNLVVRTGEQAAHLTRQMLAYSGKGRLLLEQVNLSALFAGLTEIVRPSISKKIGLVLELAAGLDPVEADPSQMQQIFTNLVLNAAEAIGDREGTITIRTGAWTRTKGEGLELEPGEYVYVEVGDTGCGMDERTRARVFEPFFTTKFAGRGLGLAAVAGIVRTQKGAIHVESAPGEGTRMTVLLPAVRAPEDGGNGGEAGRRGTVLVVDDEAVVRDIASRALERKGFAVIAAANGDEAREMLAGYPGISLVLLDIRIPGRGGVEILEEIRGGRPELPVVIVSGFPEQQTMRQLPGLVVSGFLAKPFKASELVLVVETAIGRAAGGGA